ncbi:WW domain-containing protein [Mycena indigotica]|uniref:WW domain-containing protein n=1 Tax=Mycena indigotica TaxID=2126181 RepID=A0A8H6S9G1_9AGAR|nr:WW domain-containing protein [Mycena indigotica]KAF7294581.1 WW domain-containing protein [Mycena indigotica]
MSSSQPSTRSVSTSKPQTSPALSASSPSPTLPAGWIKQYDPASQRHFYVDTTVPRSTWSHPYEDEQYIREHGHSHAKQHNSIRRHSSASQGIASPVIVAHQQQQKPQHHHHHHRRDCPPDEPQEPARKKARLSIHSPENFQSPGTPREDLTREFEGLLRRDFSFAGQYCHAATMTSAANPGLSIKGIGVVGLPLSDRDADLVRQVISPSSTPDQTVGNAWELGAQLIECMNPAWSAYLEEVVLKDIWRKLTPHASGLRLKLQSLILWEQSHNPMLYECTQSQQSDSTEFASVHVILPSTYTGGHVQLSFASSSEHYDLSPTSSFSTSFVAWYHGVECQIKPIESGRRLALSYRLVVSEGPRPTLPVMTDKLQDLRRFLRKWSNFQEYEPDSVPTIIAYTLAYEYHDDDLRGDTLKLEDRHKIIHLKSLCDELGFQLGLATLDDHLIGTADESASRDAQGRPKRMLRVNNRRLNIKEVYDFDGLPIQGMAKLELEEGDLVPPPESAPDLVVYDAKNPHVIEFHHSRTVIVIFEKRRTVEMLLHTRKTPYALERLHNVDRRNSSLIERKIVSYVLSSLYHQQPYNFDAQARLAEISLGWHDAKLWNETARSSVAHGPMLASLDQIRWLDAWKQFTFSRIRESIEQIWEKKGAHKGLEFYLVADPDIYARVADNSNALEEIRHWSGDQLQRCLDGLQNLEREHVPLFISAIRKKGIMFFWEIIMRAIIRVPNAYEFWLDFLGSLYTLRLEMLPKEHDSKKFNEITDEGLDSILSDFGMVVRSGNIPLRGQRLSEIIGLCLSIRRLDMCRRVLFMTVPRDQSEEWIPVVTSPGYVPQLRRTLHEHGMEVYHKPFCDFFSAAIGCFLHFVVGAYSNSTRKICGSCTVCSALDDFLVSPNLTQAHFVGTKSQAEHLEAHLVPNPDVASFHSYTDTNAGTITVVSKLRNPATDPHWLKRKNAALEFLATVGDMKIIDRIMGRRYNDAMLAIEGKGLFVHLEDGSRAGSHNSSRGIAIHHQVQGRWAATSVTDEPMQNGR